MSRERAEIFFIHGGLTVFHAYKNPGEYDDPSTYHYALSPEGEWDVDVRDLTVPENVDPDNHEAILRQALRDGLIDTQGQHVDDENPNALSDGQRHFLDAFRGLTDAAHIDHIPETLDPVQDAIVRRAATLKDMAYYNDFCHEFIGEAKALLFV